MTSCLLASLRLKLFARAHGDTFEFARRGAEYLNQTLIKHPADMVNRDGWTPRLLKVAKDSGITRGLDQLELIHEHSRGKTLLASTETPHHKSHEKKAAVQASQTAHQPVVFAQFPVEKVLPEFGSYAFNIPADNLFKLPSDGLGFGINVKRIAAADSDFISVSHTDLGGDGKRTRAAKVMRSCKSSNSAHSRP